MKGHHRRQPRVDATAVATAQTDGAGGDALPVVETRDALSALDNVLMASADAETVKFLLDGAKAKLWRHAYVDPGPHAPRQRRFTATPIRPSSATGFWASFAAEAARSPRATHSAWSPRVTWCCQPDAAPRCGVRARNNDASATGRAWAPARRYQQSSRPAWSALGLTIVCCPNAVVTDWSRRIAGAFPGSDSSHEPDIGSRHGAMRCLASRAT